MHEHPPHGLPNILVHGGAHAADHPAVPIAAAYLAAHPFGLRAVPELVPRLAVEVTHYLLILGAVAGHHIPVRVDKEGIKAHIAGQKPLLTIDIVDEAVVEVGAEPLLGAVGIEQLVDEVLEVLRHHRAVVDDVLRLHKVEAVVQRRRCKLHVHLVGEQVQRHQVRRVLVLHGHAEADVLHAHLHELFERRIAAIEAVLQAADLVIGLFQALDGDADADLRELPAQIENAVGEEPVGGDDDAVALFIELAHDLFKVLPDEGLAARDVGKIHFGELSDRLDGELLFGPRGRFIAIAHGAARVAAICNDDRSV